ncbi:hypothetical protein BZA70DRAFT_123381 [Myxozyma melibiosi]|uniref:Mediator of RNA polymerase II transcription subunit 9 n=1 Tax=Myxozyma melibiosi TaxID=54550 RepID=A0ABR1F8H9_9ASCO
MSAKLSHADFDFLPDLVDLLERVSQGSLVAKDVPNEAGRIRINLNRVRTRLAQLGDVESIETQNNEIIQLKTKVEKKRLLLENLSNLGKDLLGRKGVLRDDELSINSKQDTNVDVVTSIPAPPSVLELAKEPNLDSPLPDIKIEPEAATIATNQSTSLQPAEVDQMEIDQKVSAPADTLESNTGDLSALPESTNDAANELQEALPEQLQDMKEVIDVSDMQDFMQMMDGDASAAEKPSQEQDGNMFMAMMDSMPDDQGVPETSAQGIEEIAQAIAGTEGELPEFMDLS